MNMIEIFKRKTTQVSRLNMKKTFISIFLLSTIIFSFNLYANGDTFEVSAKCKDEYNGEFKHEVRQFQKPYDNQQAEQTSLMV